MNEHGRGMSTMAASQAMRDGRDTRREGGDTGLGSGSQVATYDDVRMNPKIIRSARDGLEALWEDDDRLVVDELRRRGSIPATRIG